MSKDLGRQEYVIRANLEARETEDLLEIWHLHDTAEWTDTAFDVLQDILLERLGEVPRRDPEFANSRAESQGEGRALPDFLHNTDKVFSISYWAKILSWVLLVLYLGNSGLSIANNIGSIGKLSDLVYLVGPLITTTIGIAYFVILQAVSEGLLVLVDIAIDVSEAETGPDPGS